jgi:hypothetical protein
MKGYKRFWNDVRRRAMAEQLRTMCQKTTPPSAQQSADDLAPGAASTEIGLPACRLTATD